MNLNYLYPKPARNSAGPVLGQALSVTGSNQSFTGYASTEYITLLSADVQGGNVYVTFDGSTPASGTGHILKDGSSYTWSKAAFDAAKFTAVSTPVTIYATPFSV